MGGGGDGEGGARAFVAFTDAALHLPPAGAPHTLLGPSFVRVRPGAREDALLQCLGISRCDEAAFFARHVLPALPRLPAGVRDAALAQMLTDVARLDAL